MGNMICEVHVRLSCNCKGCWGKVSRAVSKRVPGVKSINIDKEREIVTIRGEVDASSIVNAISTVKKATASIILIKPEEEAQPLPQPIPPPSPPSRPPLSPPPAPPMPYVYHPDGQYPRFPEAATQFQNLVNADKVDNVETSETSERVHVTFRNSNMYGHEASYPGSEHLSSVEIHDGYGRPDQAHNPGYGYSYTWQPAVPPPPPPAGNGNHSYWPKMSEDNVSGSCTTM